MRRLRRVEIRERARRILGVTEAASAKDIKTRFRAEIRQVNYDAPQSRPDRLPGYANADVARLLIQAYGLLSGRHGPTTMLEDDALVGAAVGGEVTPIRDTMTYEQWHREQFFEGENGCIWSHGSAGRRKRRNADLS